MASAIEKIRDQLLKEVRASERYRMDEIRTSRRHSLIVSLIIGAASIAIAVAISLAFIAR